MWRSILSLVVVLLFSASMLAQHSSGGGGGSSAGSSGGGGWWAQRVFWRFEFLRRIGRSQFRRVGVARFGFVWIVVGWFKFGRCVVAFRIARGDLARSAFRRRSGWSRTQENLDAREERFLFLPSSSLPKTAPSPRTPALVFQRCVPDLSGG